ncbi:hypothetical protein EIP86_004463 [Pleurotus ostreatoroseus]|nr:hypothetical protein EIP86_004463 [Pleurotus ostreatoroseus]
MIVDADDTKKALDGSGVDSTEAQAGPSSSSNPPPLQPPPSFEQSTSDAALRFPEGDVFVPPGGEPEGPPPAFAPYEASYFEKGDGTIVSHDPHLNEDGAPLVFYSARSVTDHHVRLSPAGEALYRFLLAHAQTPPQLLLRIHGEHTEERTRQVQRTSKNGRTTWHTETDTHTVVDFDFAIDLSPHVAPAPTHFTRPDGEPAFRGKMHTEVDAPSSEVGGAYANADIEMSGVGRRVRRRATRQERKTAKAWEREREARGLPPWVGPETDVSVVHPVDVLVHQTNVLKSSKTVREWADEYCASKKLLKEFTYHKVVYGWNYAALQAAIVAAIHSTFYQGAFTVTFTPRASKIHIRANNWLARTLSHTWALVLLWLTLIYPFLWLFKRFARDGGGRWEVCGGAYPLKAWQYVRVASESGAPPPPHPHSGPGPDAGGFALPPSYTSGAGAGAGTGGEPGAVVQTDKGAARLVGMREGEWFARWEGAIRRAVTNRVQSRTPLDEPDAVGAVSSAALALDGYSPHYTDGDRSPYADGYRPHYI